MVLEQEKRDVWEAVEPPSICRGPKILGKRPPSLFPALQNNRASTHGGS